MLPSVKPASPQMRSLGKYPTTTDAEGQTDIDLEGFAEGKLIGIGKFGLRFLGPVKHWFRRVDMQIVAHHASGFANRIFANRWIQRGGDIRAQLRCIVPRELDSTLRTLSCWADFKDSSGQAVEKARRDVAPP